MCYYVKHLFERQIHIIPTISPLQVPIGWIASILFDTFTVMLFPSDTCGRTAPPNWHAAMLFITVQGAEQPSTI